MLTKLEALESQLAELRAKISPIAFEQWLGSSTTKALKKQLEVDLEELKENWISSRYIGDEEIRARGQAQYIEEFFNVIPMIRGEDNDKS